jgi:hypothetical protein
LHARIVSAHRFVHGGVAFEEQRLGFLVSILRGQAFAEPTLRKRSGGMARLEGLGAQGKGVAAIEWLGPLMAGGNLMPELIRSPEGAVSSRRRANIPPDWSGQASSRPIRKLSSASLRVQDCANHPRSESAHGESSLAESARSKAGARLPHRRHHYFNRPGPRLVESAEIVVEILHPDRFNFRHHGTGWIPIDEVQRSGA